ncbi:hypothetical protein KP509_34G058400 [Ceratopteris richardii]|uniref:Uncharacterized protein n=1 Tax=Ceratopteris richardii TaxID=49495 RepID=A0A8T2QKS8_CERRI|nr:hypothetical protein KP509_34G058400 [Ceratopteris richardii]
MAKTLSANSLVWESPLHMVTPSPALQPGPSGGDEPKFADLQLGPLDLMFDYHNSVILFYDARPSIVSLGSNGRTSERGYELPEVRLRRALEQLLVHQPSAAGVLVQNESGDRVQIKYPVAPFVDGDGAKRAPFVYGVPFHVAHANIALADLGDVSIPDPSLDILYPPMPKQGVGDDGCVLPRFVMSFQVTTFTCGGFSIAHVCSHAYADGYTAAVFIQNLCSIARGEGLAVEVDRPVTSTTAVMGPREPPCPTLDHSFIKAWKPAKIQGVHLQRATATRMVVSMEALKALRNSVGIPCSRNQVLLALLWRAHARVRRVVHGLPGDEEEVMAFPMNLRTRGIPGVGEGFVGNAVYLCPVRSTISQLLEMPLSSLVRKIRRAAVENLDIAACTQSLIDYVELQLREGLVPRNTSFTMPSLVSLPFYETDCGWGRPTYVGRPSQQIHNLSIVLDHPAANAWNVLTVFRSLEERACFEEVFRDYVS